MVEGCKARQRCDLLSVQGAKFGAGNDQLGGGVHADGGNRIESFDGGLKSRIGGDKFSQMLVDVGELLFQKGDGFGDAGLDAGVAGLLGAVFLLDELLDELASACREFAQIPLCFRGNHGGCGIKPACKERQEPSVDGVGFGLLVERFSEGFRLGGSDDADGNLVMGQIGGDIEFEPSGGFHDGQLHPVLCAQGHQLAASVRSVGESSLEEPAIVEGDRELEIGLADINAGEDVV